MKNTIDRSVSRIMPWVRASRLTAHMFIFPSILFGQILWFWQSRDFSMLVFILVHIYGLFMHLFIVYANDYSDFDTDKLNKTYTIFSGGSRVLLEGVLSRKKLLIASLIMSFLCILIGLIFWIITSSPLILGLIMIGLFLLYAYSFKPFEISYRGFGETLQMLGVGLVLPLIGFVSQSGSLDSLPWMLIVIVLPSQLAMAISTSLPDQPSDSISLKRTSAVLLGQKKAQGVMILMYITSLVLFIMTQSSLYLNFWGIVIIVLLALLICFQIFLSLFKNAKPGTRDLFVLVLLSILTNTSFVVGITYLLIA